VVHTIITVLAAVVAVVAIFLFKNRKLQMGVTGFAMGLSAALLGLYLFETQQFINGSVSPWSILYFAILVCLFMAYRGIKKDEKLIKSMDRFR
jgi:uncharacterized membrane protein